MIETFRQTSPVWLAATAFFCVLGSAAQARVRVVRPDRVVVYVASDQTRVSIRTCPLEKENDGGVCVSGQKSSAFEARHFRKILAGVAYNLAKEVERGGLLELTNESRQQLLGFLSEDSKRPIRLLLNSLESDVVQTAAVTTSTELNRALVGALAEIVDSHFAPALDPASQEVGRIDLDTGIIWFSSELKIAARDGASWREAKDYCKDRHQQVPLLDEFLSAERRGLTSVFPEMVRSGGPGVRKLYVTSQDAGDTDYIDISEEPQQPDESVWLEVFEVKTSESPVTDARSLLLHFVSGVVSSSDVVPSAFTLSLRCHSQVSRDEIWDRREKERENCGLSSSCP